MERLKKSQSSLLSETGWTIHCTLLRSALRGCCWTFSLKPICEKILKNTCTQNYCCLCAEFNSQLKYFFHLSSSVLSLEESVKAMSLSAEEDDIPWDNMRDNRDLTVFTSWDPKERHVIIFMIFFAETETRGRWRALVSKASVNFRTQFWFSCRRSLFMKLHC